MNLDPGLFTDKLPQGRSEQVARILQAALDAADPALAVQRAIQISQNKLQVTQQDFSLSGRVRLVGAGKAACAMARGTLSVLGDRISDGILITKHVDESNPGLPARIRVLPGGHPVPSKESIASTRELVDFLQDCQESDLILCLISGGGSALMTWPQEGISLEDIQNLTRLLLASGADIGEMNTLRKHLDRVKGGGIARFAAPAQVLTLILSDVIGSPLDVIASGPTVADTTTFEQALDILRKYNLEPRTPAPILRVLHRGAVGDLPETVKLGDPILKRVTNQIVANNPQAAQASIEQAQREGYHALLLTTYLAGEASQVGGVLSSLLQQIDASGQPLPRPACLVAGGETTVTLRGSGLGGRNQEEALGAAFGLKDLSEVALLTLGTDGEDGPTNAAGALVTGDTISRARALGLNALEFLQTNDSYHFFKALGDLLITGPTGTNVNDLVFLFAF